ncbi:hypothetical protein [Paenibacillus cremeus]|nr:hypothetical protein [Paenibacillus cremeus]
MTIPITTVERIEKAMKMFDDELRDKPDWQGWMNKKSHKFAIL